MSYLRYVRVVFISSCLQDGSCLIYVMFTSSLSPVVCRKALVLFTLCSLRLYLQLFVGGLLSYLRYVRVVFTSSCLQEGSCLIYVMFGSSLSPVVCRRAHVLFTLCSGRLYLQLFVGGLLSYLRYVRVVFTSSCLQDGSCLIYVMFASSLSPVVCRRAHVLFTLCSLRLYLQLIVGGLLSYLRYVLVVFTSSCLQEGSCLIYVMFTSSLSPVVCRKTHVLFTLCSGRLYLQLFVGGLLSYLRYVHFVFISSCLQEGSCLIYVMFGSSLPPVVCRRAHVLFTLCSRLQLFVGRLLSYLRYVRFVFISSCLQECSCLFYVMFASFLSPVDCRRALVLFTLCWLRFYLQLFVGGLLSYLRFVRVVFISSCLQECSCLIYVMFASFLSPVVCRRALVLFTLCSGRLYLQLFVRGLLSYLRYVRVVFPPVVCKRAHVLFTLCLGRLYLHCLQEGSCLIYVMFTSSLPPVVCRTALVLFTLCSLRLYLQLFVGVLLSYLRYVRFVFISSCLQEGSCLIYVMFGSSLPPVVCRSALVLFTLCSCRLYLQLFVGGLLSYLRYVHFVFISSCLQEGSCLIYVMFGSSLPPVVCRRAHVLFTLCSGRLYLQLFVGGLMSYLRYVRVVFTSSCLQECSCLIYVMFGSSLPSSCLVGTALVLFTLCSLRLFISSCLQEGARLYVDCKGGYLFTLFSVPLTSSLVPPVVCRRALVLFTLCSPSIFISSCLQEGSCPYLRYVRFVFTSSCLQEGSCLIYVMFGSSLPPVVCRRLLSYLRYVHFVFISSYLQEGSSYLRYVHFRLYLQLFVGGLMSYLRYVRVRLYLQLFVGRLLSYLRYVRVVFTSSCLQEALVLFTLCSLRLYLQLFVGGALALFTLCSGRLYLQLFVGGAHVLFTLCSGRLYLQLFVGRAHVLFTLCSGRLYLQLFVGVLLSYLRYVRVVFTSSCLQDGSCLILRYVRFVFISS